MQFKTAHTGRAHDQGCRSLETEQQPAAQLALIAWSSTMKSGRQQRP